MEPISQHTAFVSNTDCFIPRSQQVSFPSPRLLDQQQFPQTPSNPETTAPESRDPGQNPKCFTNFTSHGSWLNSGMVLTCRPSWIVTIILLDSLFLPKDSPSPYPQGLFGSGSFQHSTVTPQFQHSDWALRMDGRTDRQGAAVPQEHVESRRPGARHRCCDGGGGQRQVWGCAPRAPRSGDVRAVQATSRPFGVRSCGTNLFFQDPELQFQSKMCS